MDTSVPVMTPQSNAWLQRVLTNVRISLWTIVCCRYYNLCPSVLIIDPEHKGISGRDARVTVEQHTITHNVLVPRSSPPEYKIEERTYTFATHIQGVLPRLLRRLIEARKAVKKLMASATDPLQKAVLNGRQNGIKVACNSVYGFCGVDARKGMLPCKPVAAVTTLKGRAFIEFAKSYVEGHYEGSKVVYGGESQKRVIVMSE
jgi:DNA polymerase elongation subunit (family B)